MKCDTCGKEILERLNYCPTCKINNAKIFDNKTLDSENNISNNSIEIQNEERTIIDENFMGIESVKKNENSSIVAFYLSIIPYLLFAYCFIGSGGSADESGSGAVWWLMIFYFWTIGFPIMLASIIFGIKGLESKKKIFSYIAITLTLVPGLFLLSIMLGLF